MGKLKKSFKLIFTFVFIFFTCISVSAKDLNISIEDVKIVEKSSSVTTSDIEFLENTVTSNINFSNKNDYVVFEVELKNNSSEDNYKILNITDNNNLDNLDITYEFNEDLKKGESNKFKVKILYKEKLVNQDSININDLMLTLNLMDDNGSTTDFKINNPTTGDGLLHYLVLLIISITGLYFVRKKTRIKINNKKIKAGTLVLLLGLIILPFCVFANEKYQISLKFNGIKLESEYLDYTVSFNTNGGNNIDSREITYGQPIGELPEALKNGYTFNGWKDSEGNNITNSTVVTDAIELKADYTLINYDISYDLKGGKVTPSDANKVKYTIEDEFDLVNPTRRGYTFAGWSGTGISGTQTRVTISHETGEKSYTANWSTNNDTPYNVLHKYKKLDGTYEEELEELSGPTDTTVTAPIRHRAGFTDPDLQEVTITATDDIPTVTYIYNREMYTLTLNDDIETTFTNPSYPYETEITLTAKDKANHEFTGWSNGESNKTITFKIKANTDIYPLYNVTGYTVTYNANGGNFYNQNVVTNNIIYVPNVTNNNSNYEIVEGTYKVPTKTDNAFKGWYTDSNCTEGNEFDIESANLEGDIEVYAKWQEGIAMFIDGPTLGNFNYGNGIINVNSTSFSRSNTLPEEYKSDEYVVSTDDSDIPIYMWYEDETKETKWYSDVTKAYLNSDSSYLFGNTKFETVDVSGLSTDYVTNMFGMFWNSRNIRTLDLRGFNTSNVTRMDAMFQNCGKLENVNLSSFDTKNVETMRYMFNSCSELTSIVGINNFNTIKVTLMDNMFSGCGKIVSIDVSSFNTSNVTDMHDMFKNCTKLQTLDVSGFNTVNVEDFSGMFSYCNKLATIDVSEFNTASATNMKQMFMDCSAVTELDVDDFNTSLVESFSFMFYNCTSLTGLDVSGFNTSSAKEMSFMFGNCFGLISIDVGNFDTSKVAYFNGMFMNCTGLTQLDLSSFKTTTPSNMTSFFEKCNNLNKIVVSDNFVTNNVQYSGDMFKNCTSLVGGKGTIYDENHIDKEYAHIDGGTSNPGYFTSNITEYTVTFNGNGGTASQDSITVEDGEEIAELPTAERENYEFDGWYTGITDGVKVTKPYTPSGDITLYAHWRDSFSTVFSQVGACVFHKKQEGNITGDECQKYHNVKYIDTGIKLYSEENIKKDYEIGFTIDHYLASEQDENIFQQTLMNTKLEGSGYPGLVFRRSNIDKTNDYEFASRRTSTENSAIHPHCVDVTSVKIYRIYNSDKVAEIFYSINNEPKIKINDLSEFNPVFNLSVWFGAGPKNEAATQAHRYFNGTLSNMYIKLGKYHE